MCIPALAALSPFGAIAAGKMKPATLISPALAIGSKLLEGKKKPAQPSSTPMSTVGTLGPSPSFGG